MNLLLVSLFALTVFNLAKGFGDTNTYERDKKETNANECLSKLKDFQISCRQKLIDTDKECLLKYANIHKEYSEKINEYKSSCENQQSNECNDLMNQNQMWFLETYRELDKGCKKGYYKTNLSCNKDYHELSECI